MSEHRDPHDIERLEQLARFPEENPNPVLRVSPEGTVLYANDAARQTAGLLTGRKHEKLAKHLVQDVAIAVSDGTVRNVEFEASGKTYSFSLVPVADRQYVNLFGSNITESKKTEEALSEQLEFTKALVDSLPNPIFVKDREARYVLFNQAWEKAYGESPDHWIGATVMDIDRLPVELRDDLLKEDLELLKTGGGRHSETVRTFADGKEHDILYWQASIEPAAGEIVGLVGMHVDISEQKQMEKSARENEELLATILDNSPMLVALRDTEGKFLLVNKRYEEVHDVAKEGVVGKTLHELFSKEEADYYFRGDSEVIATGNVTVNEESIERDGRELVLSVTKFPIVNSSGNVTGVGIIDDDITERKRSEQALAREKQILNMTLESIDQGISMFDADLRLTSFNRNFLEILDLPADRIKVGTSLEEAFRYNAERGDYGPGDVEEQVRERLELARRFEPHQFERTRPDGTVLEIRGKPTADGGFVTTYTDITKRRRTEEKLRKSERRQARILEALSEGIYEWDIEKGTLYLSSTLAELLGLPDDALGPDDWNALIHPDDFEKYRAALRSNFKGQTERLECDYRARRENGEYRWLSDRGIPIRNEAGRAVKLVGAVRDISDRKLAERRIEETETQMRMALETLPGGLVYTDADLNVVVSNKKFAELHNVPGELLSPGEPYTGFLRYLAEHGYYGEGDLDAFVAQRVEAIRNPLDTTVDHRTPEGRIHEIRRRKVPGGGTVSVVTDVTEEKQAAEEVTRQARMLREMSTPVTQIRTGTLLLPLVGLIDSRRAHDVLNAVLDKIAATRAKVLILDISGVSVVDSTVANHLIQITRGTRLMGCDCIISGVSSAIAQTIVELGIDIEDIETTANLAQAIKEQELSFS